MTHRPDQPTGTNAEEAPSQSPSRDRRIKQRTLRPGLPNGANYYVDLTAPTRTAHAVIAVVDELLEKHPQVIAKLAGAVIGGDQVKLTVAVNLADPTKQQERNHRVGSSGMAFLADLLDNMHQHHPRTAPEPSRDARRASKTIRETLHDLATPQAPARVPTQTQPRAYA